MNQGIDHVAIAVEDLASAVPVYRDLLGFDYEGEEEIEDQKVRVAILTKGPHRIELVQPSSEDSPISRFLKKRGPGLHHICIEVKDLPEALERFRKAGLALIDETPRPGAHGRRIAFAHPAGLGGVLVELSERPD